MSVRRLALSCKTDCIGTPEFALKALPASDADRAHSAGLVINQLPDPAFYVDFNANRL